MERDVAIVKPGAGRTIYLAGDLNRFVLTGAETNGAFAQWEVVVPSGGGPRTHIHSREEEGVYVVEGEVTLTVGDAQYKAQPGMFVALPVGIPHCFKNQTDQPARLIFTVAPAGLEGFFFEAGVEVNPESKEALPSNEGEIGRILESAPRYGITIVH